MKKKSAKSLQNIRKKYHVELKINIKFFIILKNSYLFNQIKEPKLK